jgi:hypothetical protein|tara:strand:+ start:1881 stop:2072 length:192 start_codon:yes stop_codon:yes gene_type:complete
MKLFFRPNGTLSTYTKDNAHVSEDKTLTAYTASDSFNPIVKTEMTDNGPKDTYITHDEYKATL